MSESAEQERGSNSSDHAQEKLGSSLRKEPQTQNEPLACFTYFSFPAPAHILTPTETGLILMSGNREFSPSLGVQTLLTFVHVFTAVV